MSGRPRALDEVKRREVCALVSAGCGVEAAARYVGVNAVTIRREAMRNPEFYEQLRSAELGAQLSPLQSVRKAAKTHWRAAAWYLERTQPNQFARRNLQRFTERQVADLLRDIFDAAIREIDDPDTALRVCRKVQEFTSANRLEYHAIVAPRPDVHSRRKRMQQESPPENPSSEQLPTSGEDQPRPAELPNLEPTI